MQPQSIQENPADSRPNSVVMVEKPKINHWRYSLRGTAWRLFLTCWLIYALHFATNIVREIYPALSLGDHLSFNVIEYLDLHPDIFEIPGKGAYINNNPGASILGSVPYGFTRPLIDRIVNEVEISRQGMEQKPPQYDTIYPKAQEFYEQAYRLGLDIKFGLAAGVMQVFLMAPLSALSAVVMFYVLSFRSGSQKKALFLALLFAFATPVFYRAAQLNHNLILAIFAFFSFVLLWHPRDINKNPTKTEYLVAGLLAGYTVVLDYSGLVTLLFLGIYAILRWRSLRDDRKSYLDLILFSSGVALSLGILLLYQWQIFGNPFLPAQNYMPPRHYAVVGYRGMDLPHLDLLWANAFGMRYGLFLSAPLLLLALYFPAWYRNNGGTNKKPNLLGNLETTIILLLTLFAFLFTAANQFSRLQFNSGVRHMVPVVPFLFLLAADVLLLMPKPLAIVIGIISTYWSWALAMYRDVEQGFGVFESLIAITTGGPRLPWLVTLQRMSLVPEWMSVYLILIVCAGLIGALWYLPIPLLNVKILNRSHHQGMR